MPRHPQTPDRLHPGRPCSSGTEHRRAPGCRREISCRTGRRSDTRLLPSLSRVTPSAASEHSSELLGCPISRSLATCCVRLELRSLPSTGITRLPRYNEPLRHPRAPGLSLAGVRLVIPDPRLGASRVAYAFLVYMLSPLPRRSVRASYFAHSPSRISLPRKGCRVGLRIVLFEACSAFTRVTACTLALSPIRDTLSEGFSQFVTSMAAPVASGWSVCRVGLAPTGKRRLFTAHTRSRRHESCGWQSRRCPQHAMRRSLVSDREAFVRRREGTGRER